MSRRRSRADRFLSAFRDVEDYLRDLVSADPRTGFDALLAAAIPMSAGVRRHQQRLRQYGWLRNAIVHSRYSRAKPIADPREDVVADLEAIRHAVVETLPGCPTTSGAAPPSRVG